MKLATEIEVRNLIAKEVGRNATSPLLSYQFGNTAFWVWSAISCIALVGFILKLDNWGWGLFGCGAFISIVGFWFARWNRRLLLVHCGDDSIAVRLLLESLAPDWRRKNQLSKRFMLARSAEVAAITNFEATLHEENSSGIREVKRFALSVRMNDSNALHNWLDELSGGDPLGVDLAVRIDGESNLYISWDQNTQPTLDSFFGHPLFRSEGWRSKVTSKTMEWTDGNLREDLIVDRFDRFVEIYRLHGTAVLLDTLKRISGKGYLECLGQVGLIRKLSTWI